jgi:hypothetical protein
MLRFVAVPHILSAGDLKMEEAVVTSVEFPLQYTNVKFTFQNIGNQSSVR